MKKYLLSFVFALCAVILVSWGYVGHQTVALIAEKHLTPQAQEAVKTLLGNQSIGDIASWADEIRDDKTFPEHFINAPLGLTRSQFEQEVISQPQDNVYKAILANEAILKSVMTSHEDKQKALKFIVHFVGDLHQPFHVSRKEDLGGNKIQVRFEDKGTNLHSLWDSRLIDKQGLKSSEMVAQLDQATPDQIKQWQSDSLMQWIWESYQIATRLYAEAKPGSKLGEEYYQTHIGIVDERIEQAGIRLAGLLNELFKNVEVASLKANAIDSTSKDKDQIARYIELKDISKHLNETVVTKGEVSGRRDMGSFVLVNLGGEYPNQLLTVMLRGESKSLAKELTGKYISVEGKVIDYKGKPEIVVTEVAKISILPSAESDGK
ncbi:S1/P1 nuclease [Mucilaginibacter agri]|uniref:S1/P1 Nuclease n=1 Tax=Mucilaginibacter agri TaxID=2695265 RepID=A0A965ZE58_9SPHI|nr:S1/P1 nuclease [Mucilaginibacter agri]NCD68031.1 hypothetical protein [Mucilaginibacter agri]